MAPQSLSPKTASLDPSQVPLTPNLKILDYLQVEIETWISNFLPDISTKSVAQLVPCLLLAVLSIAQELVSEQVEYSTQQNPASCLIQIFCLKMIIFNIFGFSCLKFLYWLILPLTWKMSKWGTGSLAKIVTLNSSRSSSIILIATWINWPTIWPTFNLSNFDLPLPCDVICVSTKTKTHLGVRSTIRSYV